MRFFSMTILGLSCAALLSMQGCTVKSTDKHINNPDDEEEDIFSSLPEDAKELAFTGILLDIYYVNADKELKDFEYYNQQGKRHGFSATEYEFPDVSYMYSTLSDNFTNYFSPYRAEQIMQLLTYSEKAVGIGAQVRENTVPACEQQEETCTDSATVLKFAHIYKDGPAEDAGIKAGDIILSVNGTIPKTVDAFERLTTGMEGEKFTLEILREGDSLEIEIALAPYITPTVFVDMYDSIPVITITEFTDTTTLPTGTYGEFIEALQETEGAKATVIDLRGNPGGSVEQCMDMTAELLPKNDTIAFMISHDIDTLTEDRVIDTLTWIVDDNGLAKDRYLVFLADSGSASCAELMLVGTISNTKSPVVGLTTYGKGIGQTYLGTYAGGITGITSMRMFDKNKKIYHRYGIEPDYKEGDPAKALDIAIQLAKERTAVRTKEYGSKDTGHFTLAKTSANAKKFDRGGAYKIIREKLQKPFPFK